MDYELLIPKDYSWYVTHFNRREYAALFKGYLERCGQFFAAAESPDAAGLVTYAESFVRPLRKKLVLFDLKTLFVLYTLPAMRELGTGESAAFAGELESVWNQRHPEQSLSAVSYSELMQGFEDAGILGFKKFLK